jgi:hypothetical protein
MKLVLSMPEGRLSSTLVRTYPLFPCCSSYSYVTAKIERKAGCYISNGYQKDFIRDGEFINLFRNSKGEPITTGYRSTCRDGVLSQSIDFTVARGSASGSVSFVR